MAETMAEEMCNGENHKPTILETQWKFKDGLRTIDFVLVWDGHSEEACTVESAEKRVVYETNLIEEGLELEQEFIEDTGLHFVKIHAPLEVLQRYAEILKLRMPMRKV